MVRRLAAVVGILLLAGCAAPVAGAVPAPVGHGDMHVLGSWTGELDDDGDGVVSMVVTEAAADGSSFSGEMTFAADRAETTGELRAQLTPEGHLVASIGDEAGFEAHIMDPVTLRYCFVRYGFDPVYSCGVLVHDD